MLVPQQACSQGSRVFCANLTPLTPVLWDQSLSKPEGIPDSLSSPGPAAQESEAQLDTYIKYKTFGHLMCQKHFLERLNTPASDCVQRGGGVSKTTFAWPAHYFYQFISKRACETLLGSSRCSLGQSSSCAGPVVQASRVKPMLFGEVEDPAPHELCFAWLSLSESEKYPSLMFCVEEASQDLAGVTVGNTDSFHLKKA